MAKFHGTVAFYITKEDSERPGVWLEEIVQKKYVGDVIRNVRQMNESQNTTNSEIRITNQISIVARDGFIFENFQSILYVEWFGAKWTVSSVDISYPRLILSLGGPYAEQKDET